MEVDQETVRVEDGGLESIVIALLRDALEPRRLLESIQEARGIGGPLRPVDETVSRLLYHAAYEQRRTEILVLELDTEIDLVLQLVPPG